MKELDPRAFNFILKEINFETHNSNAVLNNIDSSAYISGIAGCGKTVVLLQIAYRLCKARYTHGNARISIETAKFTDLLQQVKNTFCKNSPQTTQTIIDKYSRCDILLIDDIGLVPISDWAYSVLYMIIDYRYSHQLVTLYTSNLSIEELSSQLGDDRIPSRIQHDCADNIFKLKKGSFR